MIFSLRNLILINIHQILLIFKVWIQSEIQTLLILCQISVTTVTLFYQIKLKNREDPIQAISTVFEKKHGFQFLKGSPLKSKFNKALAVRFS